MKRRPSAWIVSLFITFFLIPQSRLHCQTAVSDPNLVQISDPSAQLRLDLTALRRQRQDFQKTHKANQEHIDQAKQALGQLQGQHEALTEQQAGLDRQLDSLRREAAELDSQNAETSRYFASTNKLISKFASDSGILIQNGLPCQKEDRLNELSAAMETSAVSIADTLAAIWNFVQRELYTACSAEAFSKPVTLENGRTLHARLVRIGHHFLAFITEDGQLAGTWLRNSGEPRWDITADKTQIQKLTRAVEILDQQAQPVLLQLPFEISPVTPTAEQKEGAK